jgi:hypothetical protein
VSVAAPRRGRLGHRGILGGGIGGFVVLIAIVAGIVKALAPGPPPTPCPTASPCGAPPTTPLALAVEQTWTSTDLGYRFDFDPKLWTIDSQNATQVVLRSNESGSPFLVWFSSVPVAQATPDQLVAQREADLKQDILGLELDPNAPILGPEIGYLGGVGARYVGQVSNPQGPGEPVDVAIMAATDGTITTAVAVITDHGAAREAFGQSDSLVNTLLWPGGQG